MSSAVPAPVTSSVPSPASSARHRPWSKLFIVAVLAGLAYGGHRTGWKIPKFSALVGGETAEALWCDEHGVSEEACVLCNPTLVLQRPDHGWCAVHGVPNCPWEHPEVAELPAAPTIDPSQVAAVAQALALRPRTENSPACTLHRSVVQFASLEAVNKAGVDPAEVTTARVVESVDANGEVAYDPNRVAHLSSRAAGTVVGVFKQVDDSVLKGEVLAIVDSAEVGRAKAELLQSLAHERLARTNVDRLRPLAAAGDVAERQFREATTAAEEARIKLLGARQTLVNLGFKLELAEYANLDVEAAAERMQRLGLVNNENAPTGGIAGSSNLFPLVSPLDGMVVTRDVVDGEVVDTTTKLFEVVDPQRLWLTLDVRQDEIERVRIGMTVRFRPSVGASSTMESIPGRVDWIAGSVDDRTRTVKVRVEIPNADGKLRANTFGTAEIVLRDEPRAVVVPTEAVHWEGCCHVVFVQDRDWPKKTFFHVRKVRLGVKSADRTEILAGLLPGEFVAAKGSVVPASQLLKSRLGEGCGCAH